MFMFLHINWEENTNSEVKVHFPPPVNPLISKDLVAQKQESQIHMQEQPLL